MPLPLTSRRLLVFLGTLSTAFCFPLRLPAHRHQDFFIITPHRSGSIGPSMSMSPDHQQTIPFTLIKDYKVEISCSGHFSSNGAKFDADPSSPISTVWKVIHRPSDSLAGMAVRVDGEQGPPRSALLADTHGLAVDREVGRLINKALSGVSDDSPSPPPSPGTEMVSWVDNLGRDLLKGGIRRTDAHRLNLLHRGAGILVRNTKGQVFVHQRSSSKRIFPDMYDMLVGGVSHYGEDSLTTARREVEEELGVGGMGADFRFLFNCLVETDMNRCFVDVYEYIIGDDETVRLDNEEVQWGSFMELSDIRENAEQEREKWVPDGLQVWKALWNFWESENEFKGADPE